MLMKNLLNEESILLNEVKHYFNKEKINKNNLIEFIEMLQDWGQNKRAKKFILLFEKIYKEEY
jgi:hypothetical protein